MQNRGNAGNIRGNRIFRSSKDRTEKNQKKRKRQSKFQLMVKAKLTREQGGHGIDGEPGHVVRLGHGVLDGEVGDEVDGEGLLVDVRLREQLWDEVLANVQ